MFRFLVLLSFPLMVSAKEAAQWSYTYPLPLKDDSTISTCTQITPDGLKTVTDCRQDGAMKRCRLAKDKGINIFKSKEECIADLHDSTEGDG